MKIHKWNDLKAERFSPEDIEKIRKDALRDLLEEDLRTIREAAGVTQEELAEKVAVASAPALPPATMICARGAVRAPSTKTEEIFRRHRRTRAQTRR